VLIGISGTSGGAVCAALIWYAFAKGEHPIWQRLIEFWKDNTAQNWTERTFNWMIIQSIRMASKGIIPSFQMSPVTPWLQTMMQFATVGQRPEFTDFSTLLAAPGASSLNAQQRLKQFQPGGRCGIQPLQRE
jgi:NTE family protein